MSIRRLIKNSKNTRAHIALTLTSLPGSGAYDYRHIASSADGMKLFAAAFGGRNLGKSLDGGTTWSPITAPSDQGQGIACSADGTKLLYNSNVGMYRSIDDGQTWVALSAPSAGWVSAASSADGTTLFATHGDYGKI